MPAESRKITVKHYLNKRAKAKTFEGDSYFPLYIQLIVAGRKAQIKSKINEHLKIYRSDISRLTENNNTLSELMLEGYFSEKLLNEIKEEKRFPISHLLEDEVEVITRVIRLLNPFDNEDFTLNNFSFEYQKYTEEITQVLDSSIKRQFREELKTIFLRAIDEDDNKLLFTASNYFIHFINWDTSFSNFYDSTYEILPTELKAIESALNKELRGAIKAFMAYHSNVNVLKRFFEKREQGKISTLSYLDWQTDIKDFILAQFEKVFGEQRALEYVICLDNLLIQSIRSKAPSQNSIE